MNGWFARGWAQFAAWWRNLPANVRVLLLGTLVALGLAAGFLYGAAPPRTSRDLVPLPGQPYSSEDLAAVVERLQEAGVPFQQGGRDGLTVLVNKNDLLKGQLAIAQAGINQAPPGWELFDRTNLTATDFDRRVMYLRAMQGELSQAIGSLDSLKSANVQLSIPEESAFIREQKPVKAAVMVTPKPGRSLSRDEVQGIVRFLTGAVPGLDTANVVVIDNTGRALTGEAGVGADAAGGLDATRRLQAQLEYKTALEQGVQSVLDTIFGPGNASVMVNVTLDYDSKSVESTEYSQPQVRSQESASESFEGTGATPGGTAMGTDANSPSPPTYQSAQSGGSSTYERESKLVNYELNQVKTLEVKAPGQVQEITVGVFLNQKSLAALGDDAAQTVQAVQTAVARAVGAPPENVSVAAVPFDNPLLDAFREPQPAPQVAEPALSPTVLGLGAAAALFVLVALFLLMRRREPRPAMEYAGAGMDLESLAAAQQRSAPAAEPEGEELPRAGIAALGREPTREELAQLLGEEFLQKATDPVRKKLREEVQRLVETNPESVAQLVRAWLTEER